MTAMEDDLPQTRANHVPLSPVSFMLSLRTMIDHEAAREFDATVGFTVAGDSFLAEFRTTRGIFTMKARRAWSPRAPTTWR